MNAYELGLALGAEKASGLLDLFSRGEKKPGGGVKLTPSQQVEANASRFGKWADPAALKKMKTQESIQKRFGR